MASKMIDMGVGRKEMYPAENDAPKKSSENEKEYPELHLSGPHAEMMGAEDLQAGDVVDQTVRWRVKEHSKREENGKTSFTMSLRLEKASDCSASKSDEKTKGDEDDGDGADDSPAMAYISGRAKSAD